MQIEKINIELLKPYANNAKIHTPEQVEQIVASIRAFGNNDPIAVDENNVIVEGHGRLLALQKLGYKEVEVIRLSHMTDEQKRAYILVHNKLTMITGFDLDLLETELDNITSVDMGAFDFDMDVTIDTDMTFDDDSGEPAGSPSRGEPRCKRGQLWQLGRHRLMVGDSTDAGDVDKLTDGAEMDLCVTDPPYNVNYEGGTGMKIQNDNMDDGHFYDFILDFYKQMLRVLKPGGSYYIFHADSQGLNFRSALSEAGGQVKQNLIWVKNSMVLGRQDYQWKHEPILYGWKDGAGHYFTPDRCQTTIFESRPDLESLSREELLSAAKFMQSQIDSLCTTTIRENRPTRSELHPTMKPVPLCSRLIRNSSKRGEKVIDFFGGSGSTLMACEECGRTAFTMELDPSYADVIISRWEEATGEKAVRIDAD